MINKLSFTIILTLPDIENPASSSNLPESFKQGTLLRFSHINKKKAGLAEPILKLSLNKASGLSPVSLPLFVVNLFLIVLSINY